MLLLMFAAVDVAAVFLMLDGSSYDNTTNHHPPPATPKLPAFLPAYLVAVIVDGNCCAFFDRYNFGIPLNLIEPKQH